MIRTTIIDLDHLGNGIAKEDSKIIFIPKMIPNDIGDIEIIKQHKKFSEGRLINLVKPSDDRINFACPYYQQCGGCNISNLSYENQLAYKQNKIINIFKRYLNLAIKPEIIKSDQPIRYRNKITYHYDSTLGLVSLDNQVIAVDDCLLVSEKVNDLFRLIKKLDLSSVKKITIRECSNGLVLSIDGLLDLEPLKEKCINIYQNNQLMYQTAQAYLQIRDLKYFVSNKSFFQVNTSSISKLYDQIIKYGDFSKADRIIDLYCGVGSISLYIAKYVKHVLGIELIPEAIEDAKKNALNNNINNVSFICGDVGLLIDKYHDYDKVIVDPPRAGLDKHTIQILNNSTTKRIIYVSCDPMTLVRDIKLLDNYQVTDVTLVDMFPQTHHIETVIKLQRQK